MQALVWALGHDKVTWDKETDDHCQPPRECTTDVQANITICKQLLGSMATQIYHEGNYTLNHSMRGHGNSLCLLQEKVIAKLGTFDVAFVQSVAW